MVFMDVYSYGTRKSIGVRREEMRGEERKNGLRFLN